MGNKEFKVSFKEELSKDLNLLAKEIADTSARTIILYANKYSDTDKDDLTYKWDLGNGHTSERRRYTHTYEISGVYTIGLGAVDNTDNQNSIAKTSIDVLIPSVENVKLVEGDTAIKLMSPNKE